MVSDVDAPGRLPKRPPCWVTAQTIALAQGSQTVQTARPAISGCRTRERSTRNREGISAGSRCEPPRLEIFNMTNRSTPTAWSRNSTAPPDSDDLAALTPHQVRVSDLLMAMTRTLGLLLVLCGVGFVLSPRAHCWRSTPRSRRRFEVDPSGLPLPNHRHVRRLACRSTRRIACDDHRLTRSRDNLKAADLGR